MQMVEVGVGRYGVLKNANFALLSSIENVRHDSIRALLEEG